jgi:hypothetical protein
MTWLPRPPTPPHLRRYGWLRLYSDFASHAKWRAIALGAGVPVYEVVAVAITIICKANVGRPRGSLAEFSVIECAAGLDLPVEHVARIYAAMEAHGWIDQDYLVTWDERQPDKEDPTAKDRMRRMRERRKAERLSTERYGVTGVTSRPDKTSKQEATNESSVNWVDNAEKWLSEQGVEMIARGGKVLISHARVTLTRWRNAIRDDEALRNIINVSFAHAAEGCFLNLVNESIGRHRETARLPLGPVELKPADESG